MCPYSTRRWAAVRWSDGFGDHSAPDLPKDLKPFIQILIMVILIRGSIVGILLFQLVQATNPPNLKLAVL
jgi:hypothetical protein